LVEGEAPRKKKRYSITPKGEEVLSNVDDIRRLMGIELGSLSLLSEE
jgi:predicted transcriptional regulator